MLKPEDGSIYGTFNATEDETSKVIKKAKTDVDRHITYDPDHRPEVANLLRIASLSIGRTPEQIAEEVGDRGAAKLKELVTDSLNNYLVPVRTRRRELEKDTLYIRHVLERGIEKARDVGSRTLQEVRDIMKMGI